MVSIKLAPVMWKGPLEAVGVMLMHLTYLVATVVVVVCSYFNTGSDTLTLLLPNNLE